MSIFRDEFFAALEVMLRVSADPLLQDVMPVHDPHNVSARILRHGLAVSAFALLEKYLKSIFETLVEDVGKSKIIYKDLPDELRKFIVVDSIDGLKNNLFFQKDPQQKIIQAESSLIEISKYQLSPPSYTSYGFSPTGSNVGHEDVKRGFIAFGVKDPWRQLASISSLIGASAISLNSDYKTLAMSRNSSAHDPASNIPTADLQKNIGIAVVIGIAADLLAKGVGRAIQRCPNKLKLEHAISTVVHKVRFLDAQPDGSWLERPALTGKATKKYTDRSTAKAGMLKRATSTPVIVRGVSTLPIELFG